MDDVMDVCTVLGDVKVQAVKEALEAWSSHQSAIGSLSASWSKVETHVKVLQEALEAQKARLRERDSVLDQKERDMNARLEEFKQSAYASVEAERSKLQKEKEELEELLKKLPEGTPYVKKASSAVAVASTPEIPKKVADAPAGSLAETVVEKEKPKASSAPTVNGKQAEKIRDVKVRPEIQGPCETMDGKGLRLAILKMVGVGDYSTIASEISVALGKSFDPVKLILDALKDSPLVKSDTSAPSKSTPAEVNERKTCASLLEGLVCFIDGKFGVSPPAPLEISAASKAQAKVAADHFLKLGTGPDKGGSGLSLFAFMLALAAFGIDDQYEIDKLLDVVTLIARRKEAPALCLKLLSLASKLPEVVKRLANDGKPQFALRFAKEFSLWESINPVQLLKDSLKAVRKTVRELRQNGKSQNDTEAKEISALRAVKKCIEEFGLQKEYPVAPLDKQIDDLERAKSNRKKKTIEQQQLKAPRPNQQQPHQQLQNSGKKPPGNVPESPSSRKRPRYESRVDHRPPVLDRPQSYSGVYSDGYMTTKDMNLVGAPPHAAMSNPYYIPVSGHAGSYASPGKSYDPFYPSSGMGRAMAAPGPSSMGGMGMGPPPPQYSNRPAGLPVHTIESLDAQGLTYGSRGGFVLM
eukprot:TRINITY_DN848_c0_g1_i3.p1 TRINITY_DN848_c0_g1~~TRINITY_DN848_c0_g1_i3.p1  ORF type:complete len:646 (-),score=139.78 TRINITY_DN848_c0_g1_i3:200-2116(-)